MNFREAEAYLYSLGNEVSAMKLGLDAMRTLLRSLGHPQNKYIKVQVAGTNGKGSVCAFLDSICNAAGIKTGTFTSPHLVSITERVRINGADITDDEFARHASIVRETAEGLVSDGQLDTVPTFFEQVTAIALNAFGDAAVDLAVLETGLGGRLDATTAANAQIAVITRIDLDHQEYLGETIEEIAAEKAAIIDNAIDVVIGSQNVAAMEALLSRCEALGRTPRLGNGEFDWAVNEGDRPGYVRLDTFLVSYPEFRLGLPGGHQIENAQTAVLACQEIAGYIDVGDDTEFCDAIFKGLQEARHPGRLEYHGKYLFDGAHNPSGAKALAGYLKGFEKRSITMVFGAMHGKDVGSMVELLAPLCERMILTEPDNQRSLSYGELLDSLPSGISKEKVFVTNVVSNALTIADEVTPDDGIVLVTGSLYLVGEVKKLLKENLRSEI